MSDLVLLRYLGTSDTFEDGVTGLKWTRHGDQLGVTPNDAARLQHVSPFELFDAEYPAPTESAPKMKGKDAAPASTPATAPAEAVSETEPTSSQEAST